MKELIKGNIALCRGAIDAGLDAYFGYPITPQNEIPAYFSRYMVELGRVFIQAESEIAAANMVLGAVVTGKKALTSSSSPGISLKQETISYMAAQELPAVIVNVERGGPGLGNISGSQGDYFQALKGGGHGDYKLLVFAPNSAQEMYEFAYDSFDLAYKYRMPVLILADGIIGQMMEPVDFNRPKLKAGQTIDGGWALTGAKNRPSRSVKSLLMKDDMLERHNLDLQAKYETVKAAELKYESFMLDDAEIIITAFGIMSRIAKSAIKIARDNGIKVGLLRPKTLFPFPSRVLESLAGPKIKFLDVELNYGQMLEDIKLSVNGKSPVEFIGRGGGAIISPDEILEKIAR
ncbi:MAG: 3-methyl-2-oxobutanoate dehydrogenase subunit VorB [Elusimicrobiota bacterium]|jgi:2-oxoglutarate ferredoxin oxidoreductase subunit alpha|nr:3-methyl-2-oxobutanoate dehydrogenase subunit VorB [Elusimicrobiota bacterium]